MQQPSSFGSSPEGTSAVGAALTRLARDGVLQTRYGGLTILDSEALHEHAKLKGDAAPEREPDA